MICALIRFFISLFTLTQYYYELALVNGTELWQIIAHWSALSEAWCRAATWWLRAGICGDNLPWLDTPSSSPSQALPFQFVLLPHQVCPEGSTCCAC